LNKQTILMHWEKFLAFEEENHLFQLKEDGLYIWDILRFHVYLDYMWENFRNPAPRQKLRNKLKLSVTRLAYLVAFLFSRSRPNLFLTCSRDKTPDGR
jgi:hypothetical protein